MNVNEIQQQLFQFIKSKLSQDVSVADEIAKLLKISSDSAYRRLRGEKNITLEELYVLANHYKISLDQLMNIQTGSFLFGGNLLNSKAFRFDAYLTGMMHNVAYFASFKEKEYYYLCKDVPIFHHWQFREFAAFKYFFWMGNLVYFPEFKNKKVSFSEYPDELWQLGQKILGLYNQIDSFEVWNHESLNSTLHQIDYYRDGQMFESDHDILEVYEAIEKTIDHLEEQAMLGYKFDAADPKKTALGKYQLYFNETVLLDNSMMAVMDNSKLAIIPHTAINYMMSRDMAFSENYYQFVQNLLRRSTLISEVSEKERARFFRLLRERIIRRKDSLHL
ncbi:MAG TPA: helix-turn-helix domain-containing protein [Chitinophagaceae bacterium]